MNFDDDRPDTTPAIEYPNVRIATPGEVRAWARRQGLDVGKRGKLSAEIRLAYEQAHAALQV